jgi:hypothetical protein
MDVLALSAELMRRSDELRARSARARATAAKRSAAADEKVEKSRRLTAAAAQTPEAVMHAHGREPTRRTARAETDDLPPGR